MMGNPTNDSLLQKIHNNRSFHIFVICVKIQIWIKCKKCFSLKKGRFDSKLVLKKVNNLTTLH